LCTHRVKLPANIEVDQRCDHQRDEKPKAPDGIEKIAEEQYDDVGEPTRPKDMIKYDDQGQENEEVGVRNESHVTFLLESRLISIL
jgi:hypothetical protein